ncbi:MAG TPA: isocitrate/isopropylmalate dehydrogenase family protein [Planctomycetia bacterium]|nr:isocitrate/isopropylmalate dehydrogenase family protein [Planctomycetia bacterium]
MDRPSDQRTLRIAVLHGDGIGIEVIDAALEVLTAVQSQFQSVRLDLQPCIAGAAEFRRTGHDLPEATLATCRAADAILLGAMGLPDVRHPDGRECTPQIALREILDLYAGLRPIRLLSAADCPLKKYDAGQIDFVIIRENTEGLFWSRNERLADDADEARDTLRISRIGSERLFRTAFKLARTRRRHVTLVDKANVLPSMVFFRKIFDEVAAEFPDVETQRVYVDAAALFLVQRPERFDVIVTENMFGDILSDLGAALIGGMGMAPSADIGDRHAVFQPSHGTAPDIAGQGIANPVATILSAAMMLDWFEIDETRIAARRIRDAVAAALADPSRRTPDLGGRSTTRDVTRAILEQL